MFQRGRLLRCSAAAAQTLTAWIARLAEQADALPRSTTAGSSNATSPEAAQLFTDIESAAVHANALHETDTLFTVFHSAVRKEHYPSDPQAWARLADLLLPFAGVEATTVLRYPGQPHSAARWGGTTALSSSSSTPSQSAAAGAATHSSSPPSYHLPVTREALLLTGGVVPLSARVPCGNGRVVAHFLNAFATCMRQTLGAGAQRDVPAEVLTAVRAVSRVVAAALKLNAATLRWELLLPALLDYLRLLHELDLRCAVSLRTADAQTTLDMEESVEVGDDGEGEESAVGAGATAAAAPGAATSSPGRMLQRMAAHLTHTSLAHGAHGARAVLFYLNGHFADVVDDFQNSDALADEPQEVRQQLYWSQQRYLIALTRSCMRGVYLYYTPSSVKAAMQSGSSPSFASLLSRDAVLTAPIHPAIESLYSRIDVVLQQNVNDDNPLQVADAVLAQMRDVHTLALLRALRMEEAAPDAYLRRALEVVDRVPASMAIEAELIAGKVRLLDLDSDVVDEEGRTAVYTDLLTSLRSLVEMRPRFNQHDGAGDAAATGAVSAADNEDDEGVAVRLDAVTQDILQRAHADVITAFCASHKDEWTNEAYNIFVTHKYHGLKVTKELIQPLLEVFSRRGDCRAFNLVDLCVLYSNETVDMTTIALLFRTCAAAGDHYRARTFLQLLNEIIPGFLVKCPATVREALRELKLLDPPPRHLFVTAEEDLVQSALGEEAVAVRRLPDAA